jgi:membrane protein
VPAPGWKDVVARVRTEVKADNVSLLSGGVAFYALLALAPGLVATVSIYGLVADPSSIGRRVNDLLGAAPVEVRNLVETQLRSITESSHAKLGVGAVAGFVVAVWSAAKGMKHLVTALNVAYDEDETRGFLRLRAISLLLTVAAIVFVTLAVFVVAVLPSALGDSALGTAGRWSIDVLRWPALGLGLVVGLAVLYRYGPDRDEPKWRWVSPGAVFATVAWLIASLLFSLYAANFGRYNETYGSLSAVIVVMLWLFLTVAAVIVGAELNAELERQTLRDSTRGPDRPLGDRGATAADTVGATAGEIRERVRDRRGAG